MHSLPTLTLNRRQAPLADPASQRQALAASRCPTFDVELASHALKPLHACGIQVLQINVGKLCNQTCRHCHVDAGPERTELMTRTNLEACLKAVENAGIPTVDITGGAPEMHPDFRWLVTAARSLGAYVIDRCNLTILLAPGYTDLPEFLARNQVEIVASLPCYLPENTNSQRGDRVFERSIAAIQKLNELGYGQPDSPLKLRLVYNPLGAKLPPDQVGLEATYRRELAARHGISFTSLYTITNMPISRFLDDLLNQGQLEAYLDRLVTAFNPRTVDALMCRNTLSVAWDGKLYDCDFNQMLDLPTAAGQPRTIQDFQARSLERRPIVTGVHCFGCTAGTGSSCQGALAI